MAVYQQVIKDEIPGTPASSITRSHGNSGLLVKRAAAQTGRNSGAYGSLVYELTAAAVDPDDGSSALPHDSVSGVLGDYHNSRQVTVLRKGRVRIAAAAGISPADTDIGKNLYAEADGTATTAVASTASSGSGHIGSDTATAFGKALGWGEDSAKAGGAQYFIVDINLP